MTRWKCSKERNVRRCVGCKSLLPLIARGLCKPCYDSVRMKAIRRKAWHPYDHKCVELPPRGGGTLYANGGQNSHGVPASTSMRIGRVVKLLMDDAVGRVLRARANIVRVAVCTAGIKGALTVDLGRVRTL